MPHPVHSRFVIGRLRQQSANVTEHQPDNQRAQGSEDTATLSKRAFEAAQRANKAWGGSGGRPRRRQCVQVESLYAERTKQGNHMIAAVYARTE